MRIALSAVLLTLAAVWAAPPLSADVDVEIDFHYFHERLSPHGHWIEVDDHGWCWYPADVYDDWRPYTHGHWVWVETDGWCWVSDYDWGWACEHYGRWYHTGHRWVWVPGYHWCGAWVVWRHGDGYVGWAPLPPAVTWEVGVGLHRGDFRYDVDIYEPSWVFCHETSFTHTHVHTVVIHQPRLIIQRTYVLGSVTLYNKTTIVNRAWRVQRAEAVADRPVRRVRIEATASLGASRHDRERDDRIRVFRPRVKEGRGGNPREVDAVEARRKTLREKHEAERRDIRGDERRVREVEDRQKRELNAADSEVRNRLQKRKPPESRRETPTRRDARDSKPNREQPAREQDRPRRETPRSEPERSRRETPKSEPQRPRRETPKSEPQRPRRENPKSEPQRPRRETPKSEPQRPRRETPKSEPQRPRHETPKSEPQRPRRENPKSEPRPKREEQPRAREDTRRPKQSGRVPNGKRKRGE
jgi:hypothetical protein